MKLNLSEEQNKLKSDCKWEDKTDKNSKIELIIKIYTTKIKIVLGVLKKFKLELDKLHIEKYGRQWLWICHWITNQNWQCEF